MLQTLEPHETDTVIAQDLIVVLIEPSLSAKGPDPLDAHQRWY